MPTPSPQAAITSTGSYVPAETPARIEHSGDALGGLVNLEKELTCSICTDILYQPLTLLNCLHTFCGGCLKEWFKWQGISAAQKYERDGGYSSSSNLPNPYTCPSCRAPVRETRPNATVTSLLEMWSSANPGKGRNEAERREADRTYSRGENVLPDIRSLLRSPRRSDSSGSEELEETGELNTRDIDQARRSRANESSGDAARRTPPDAMTMRALESTNLRVPQQDTERIQRRRERSEQSQQRVLEHQNSLRSIFGVEDGDSVDLQAEIMRQITDEGLLEGIDLSNMDPHQEEELSERIAQAFRQRRRERRRERRPESAHRTVGSNPPRNQSATRRPEAGRRRSESETRRRPAETRGITSDTRPSRASDAQEREPVQDHLSRPPVSRPRLLEAATTSSRTERRSSSQENTSRARSDGTSGHISGRPGSDAASRSTSDLPLRAQSRERAEDSRLRRLSRERSATNPEVRSVSDTWRTVGVPVAGRSANAQNNVTNDSQTRAVTRRRASHTSLQQQSLNDNNPVSTPSVVPSNGPISNAASIAQPSTRLNITASAANPTSLTSPRIPNLSCQSCKKQAIQFDLHYVCGKCTPSVGDAPFTLCLQCYRQGKGCGYWFGFGHAAQARFEQRTAHAMHSAGRDTPHIMTPERYLSPDRDNEDRPRQTAIIASTLLKQGKFCDVCLENANSCYWQCDSCNDGEWGFCKTCVNQARHCNHSLLPTKLTTNPISPDQHGRALSSLSSTVFQAKSFSIHTQCANCLKHILFAQARFHCPSCNAGDYDLCTPCYNSMVTTGQISLRNGPQGWRRCPEGHRMLVIGYDESRPDRRRIVLEGVVGGWALHEGDDGLTFPNSNIPRDQQDRGEGAKTPPGLQRWSWRDPDAGGGWKHKKRPSPRGRRRSSESSSGSLQNSPNGSGSGSTLKDIPPSGGQGMKMLALWGRFPDEGVQDELSFPRSAVIEEIVDINGDWCWGVYCRKTGLFPGGWARGI